MSRFTSTRLKACAKTAENRQIACIQQFDGSCQKSVPAAERVFSPQGCGIGSPPERGNGKGREGKGRADRPGCGVWRGRDAAGCGAEAGVPQEHEGGGTMDVGQGAAFRPPPAPRQWASSQLRPTPASAIRRTFNCAACSMHSVTMHRTCSSSERSISTTSSSCTCRITRERMPSSAKRR